jgi:hypothetical protein
MTFQKQAVLPERIGVGKNLNFVFFVLVSFVFLRGCSRSERLQAWVVTQNMVVFKDYRNDMQIPSFQLNKGDVCVLGAQKNEKVFLYTEVLCPGRGYGWTADHAFELITPERAFPNASPK